MSLSASGRTLEALRPSALAAPRSGAVCISQAAHAEHTLRHISTPSIATSEAYRAVAEGTSSRGTRVVYLSHCFRKASLSDSKYISRYLICCHAGETQ